MSLRKLCFFTILATIAGFVAVRRFNVPINKFDVPTTKSQQHDFRAKSEIPPAVFLPVQSKNTKDLGVGKLLVASRDLGDPNFAETVILLVQYDEKGVVGLILNRRTDVPLSRVLEGPKAAKDRSDKVYLGGPVETPSVFALLQSPAKVEGAEHIFGAVYMISTKALFEQSISARPDPNTFHVYLGYAGWNADQLQREVDLGAWFIFRADAGTVFNSDPDSLWPRMIRKTELNLAEREPEPADADPIASAEGDLWRRQVAAAPTPPPPARN